MAGAEVAHWESQDGGENSYPLRPLVVYHPRSVLHFRLCRPRYWLCNRLPVTSVANISVLPQAAEKKKRQACCDASMAQTTQDTTLFSDSTGQELKEQAVESTGDEVEVAVSRQTDEGSSPTPPVAGTDVHVEKATSQTSTDAQSTEPPPRPSLVPLGSTHTQSSTLTPVAPHPKRFSAVNINKKFLEKNTASGSAAASSTSSTAKSGSPSGK